MHLINQSGQAFSVGSRMTSERQRAANRANAKCSTGPRTLVGKSRSSRNAYQHGLSHSLPSDKATRAKVETFVLDLVGDVANDQQKLAASVVAKAQFELLRIRQRRADLMAELDLSNLQKLRRLGSLDRYERLAMTRRRRAGDDLYESET